MIFPVCTAKTVLQGIPALILCRSPLDELLEIIYLWWRARPFCRFLSRRRSVVYYHFTRVKNRYTLNGRNSDRQQWAQYRRFHGRLFEFLIPCNFGHHRVHKWWTERRGSLRTCLVLRSFSNQTTVVCTKCFPHTCIVRFLVDKYRNLNGYGNNNQNGRRMRRLIM